MENKELLVALRILKADLETLANSLLTLIATTRKTIPGNIVPGNTTPEILSPSPAAKVDDNVRYLFGRKAPTVQAPTTHTIPPPPAPQTVPVATWYTALKFKGYPIDYLHCTHKFLGELTPAAVLAVTNYLNYFFNESPFLPTVMVFDRPDPAFGPNRDKPVLRLGTGLEDGSFELGYLGVIRKFLAQYRQDDYRAYAPHVTLPLGLLSQTRLALTVEGYVLVRGNVTVGQWGPVAEGQI
jgi:hypothetical protein